MENVSKSEIEARVKATVAESLCVEPEEVELSSNLIKDLGAESIDFLDIMFRLEQEFNIKIPQREIENMARGGLKPEEFEVDGVLQAKGIERLKDLIPEIPAESWKSEMELRELPALFTVEVFCGIVERKLSGSLFDVPSTTKTPETGL